MGYANIIKCTHDSYQYTSTKAHLKYKHGKAYLHQPVQKDCSHFRLQERVPLHIKFIPHIRLLFFHHVFPYIISVCPAKIDQCLVSNHKKGRQTSSSKTALTQELVMVKLQFEQDLGVETESNQHQLDHHPYLEQESAYGHFWDHYSRMAVKRNTRFYSVPFKIIILAVNRRYWSKKL